MPPRKLAADEIGLPSFVTTPAPTGGAFDLSSHARAREALDFGLSVAGQGFNIFVRGEDRAGRMTATLAYLNAVLAERPVPSDWVYLHNFRQAEMPTAHRLPAGAGRRFRDAMAALVPKLRETLAAALTSEAYQARALALREGADQEVASALATLNATAQANGLRLAQGQDGAFRLMPLEDGPVPPHADNGALAAAMLRLQLRAAAVRAELGTRIETLNRGILDELAGPAIQEIAAGFAGFSGIGRWLGELRADLLENPARLQVAATDAGAAERLYAVNLLVDHGDELHPTVIIESNPTYENLFGAIEYRQAQGSIETDLTLIRPGALHHANGGVLVLRAEALAANPAAWSFLKAALRDRVIHIEEPQRAQMVPLAGAPKPKPIPLEFKLVVIGAPRVYALFFEGDPEFQTWFRIIADIDVDLPADDANLAIYARMIGRMARDDKLEGVEDAAMARLLGIAARWADRRDRVTARYELVEDFVHEAAFVAQGAREKQLTLAALDAADRARRRRNARIEERMLGSIAEGVMMIATTGGAIGQVNALTVNEIGDRRFGTPVRITARASVGRAGIVNIERDVALGGPIQQKGAMVLQGFLAGRFAQTLPLSFSCSITFEQSYGGVEGDSASLAELIAVLSDLAQAPLRQDLALTGSVNQAGKVQAIGGARWKIEGFFRVCQAAPGGLTGTQGVIVPETNRINLVLRDEVAEAVAAGRFHLWSAQTVEDAAELLLGLPAGTPDEAGDYPPDTIFGRVAARLQGFDRILAERRDARYA